jgi:hypothetical protein
MVMVHRGIATLSGLIVVCYFLLSHLEPQFFLLHLYQSLIYMVIILMLFYLEDHWAYMLGMLAPAVWLVLMFSTGMLRAGGRELTQLLRFSGVDNTVSLMAGVTAILSVLMIVLCAYRWKREYAGTGQTASTLIISALIVVIYYGILVFWFIGHIPQS